MDEPPTETDRMLVVTKSVRVPLSELQFTYARSQGPGGQNVNKVNSKATLRWAVTSNSSLPEAVRQRFLDRYRHRLTNDGDILLSSQQYRDRGRNISDCIDRLRTLLKSVSVAPKKRKPTKPTKGSKVRRRKSKEEHSQKKQQRKAPKID